MTIRNWWLNFKWNHEPEARPGGILAFWDALRHWWLQRPHLIPCAFCERRMWWNGVSEEPKYCSETCAYYGPYAREQDGDIPF